jgi:hypothetical protein
MPTIGNETFAGGGGAVCWTARAGLLDRRFGKGFGFMAVFRAAWDSEWMIISGRCPGFRGLFGAD